MPLHMSRRVLLALTAVAAGPEAGMMRVLLINPNSNQKTTDMMVRIAQGLAPDNIDLDLPDFLRRAPKIGSAS